MTPAQQLRSALALTVTKTGHLPDCGHGQWRNEWGIRKRHAPFLGCCTSGEGQPCSDRCRRVREALGLEVGA